MISRNGGRIRMFRSAAVARSDSSRIVSKSAVGSATTSAVASHFCATVPMSVRVPRSAAHPYTIDAETLLGFVIVQERDREESALLVAHHAAQQVAARIAGAEHDDAPFVLT